MDHSKIMQEVLNYAQMNGSEFAQAVGVDNAQTIYNIKSGKHGISTKLAKQIHERFPEIPFDYLKGRTKNIQKGNESVNIQSSNSHFMARDISQQKNEEIKRLNEENSRLKEQIKEYKEREKVLLKLLDKI